MTVSFFSYFVVAVLFSHQTTEVNNNSGNRSEVGSEYMEQQSGSDAGSVC
jgi:hypothetical protein